jgi:ArsR family transcriptional regulator, arsenate/arsenite/antimonite-responsive transcriptional repressor
MATERKAAVSVAKPLPTINPRRQMAAPTVVAEPRNVTVDVFKALADPIRLELLAHIAAGGPICVCHLEEALDYKQSRISKHLAILRRAGLVSSRRQGTWVYYELNQEMLGEATGFVEQLKASATAPHEADYCEEPA